MADLAMSSTEASGAAKPLEASPRSSLDPLVVQFRAMVRFGLWLAYLFIGGLALLDQFNIAVLRDRFEGRLVTSNVIEGLLVLTAVPMLILAAVFLKTMFEPRNTRPAVER